MTSCSSRYTTVSVATQGQHAELCDGRHTDTSEHGGIGAEGDLRKSTSR
jgi:hypothetical protein